MRIDSLTYFNSSLPGIRDNQSAIARLNQQIATGTNLLAPKDDPLATSNILDLSNRVATRVQFANNQDRAEIALEYEDTVLQEMRKTLDAARGLLNVSPSDDPNLRNVHAEQLKGYFSHLVGLANTRDPGGNFIFGGFKVLLPGSQQPYERTLDGGVAATTYNGTPLPDGAHSIEVDVNRLIQVNDNLDSVFQAGVPGSDLLQELDRAISTLPSGTLTQANIDGYRAVIDAALGKLDLIEHRIAGALTEVADVRETTSTLLLKERNALGDIQSLDQAAAITELKSRQTALEAAEQAYALTSGLSLFNYLG